MKTVQHSALSVSERGGLTREARLCLAAGSLVLVLVAAACHSQNPVDGLEAAVFSGDWTRLDVEAEHRANDPQLRHEASVVRGYAALVRGDRTAARAYFLRARSGGFPPSDLRWVAQLVERNPHSATALLLDGDALARAGDLKAAARQLDYALQANPRLAVARLARATLAAISGDQVHANDNLDRLVADAPLAVEALTVRALAGLAAGDLNRARADVQQALALDAQDASALNARGILRARTDDWVSAAQDFEAAFRLGIPEARQNWQVSKRNMEERGAVISEQRYLGVFSPGILSGPEDGLQYVKTHAESLIPGQREYVYIALKGQLPNDDAQRMQAQGFHTIIVDPKNADQSMRDLKSAYSAILDRGKSAVLYPDMHAWLPAQLGNDKTPVLSMFIAQAQVAWKQETATRGLQGPLVVAAHSDGTRVAIQASLQSAQLGAPPQSLYLESIRSEAQVRAAVHDLPNSQITVIQSSNNDWVTTEAQGRLLTFQPGAYRKTIETLMNIKAPNYSLIVDNSPTKGLWGVAHGDVAHLERTSQWSTFSGGKQTGQFTSTLADRLNRQTIATPTQPTPAAPNVRGGITLAHQRVIRTADHVTFSDSATSEGTVLVAVYTLFGAK